MRKSEIIFLLILLFFWFFYCRLFLKILQGSWLLSEYLNFCSSYFVFFLFIKPFAVFSVHFFHLSDEAKVIHIFTECQRFSYSKISFSVVSLSVSVLFYVWLRLAFFPPICSCKSIIIIVQPFSVFFNELSLTICNITTVQLWKICYALTVYLW